jgi:hypothetical protein
VAIQAGCCLWRGSPLGNLYIVSPSESTAVHLQRAAVEGNAFAIRVKRRSATHRHHLAVTGVMTKKRVCSA